MRSGFVAIAGRPNVGKSTLLNRLLGEKVAIVSPKPQTTRTRLLGILTREDAQLVLVDTPGIHEPRGPLGQAMVRTAVGALAEVDLVLVLVEAGPPHPGDRLVLEAAGQSRKPVILAVNKIDRLRRKTELIPVLDEMAKLADFEAVVPISALTGENLDELVRVLVARLPEGPPLFPPDMVTDQTERALAAELIREQVVLQTEQELPYTTAVQIDAWEEVPGPPQPEAAPDEPPPRRLVRIAATIHVERESQKGIVIGQGGRRLKAIGTAAREGLERLLGCRVYLELFVRVEPRWTRDPRRLREFGYG
ncbi:MAG TPA: GTPase Era [Thermodesulfobacteriota bacterium]|nr:GTPase Era [Thermodesulfobacteriota bacterium]